MRDDFKRHGLRVIRRRGLSKEAFGAREPALRTELLDAQYRLRDADFPVILLLAGSDRDAVIESVSRLHQWMDARLMDLALGGPPSDVETREPYFHRHWIRLPAKGRIGIFPFAWAHDALLARVDPKLARRRGAPDDAGIIAFERLLEGAGALVLKLWFHLDADELHERRKRRHADPLAAWDADRKAGKRFRKLEHSSGDEAGMLAATNHPAAPWRVLHVPDTQARDLLVGEMVRDQLRARLDHPPVARIQPSGRRSFPDRLAALVPPPPVAKSAYEDRLEALQGRLNQLARHANRADLSTVLVFEGPDAAGKGGAIRRVTRGIRAPVYRVVPIGPPTEGEKDHHYLWRFWRALPRAGQITVFDRSWYGRVLVERVEEFARPDEWRRAYAEIVAFERQLVRAGVLLVKFWIDVGEAEQERRFAARGTVPFKKYKLSPEDFRNRAKRPAYRDAANEMFARTNAPGAKWNLVQGDDKPAARLRVLAIVCRAMERALAER